MLAERTASLDMDKKKAEDKKKREPAKKGTKTDTSAISAGERLSGG